MTQLGHEATAHELTVIWPQFWAWEQREAHRQEMKRKERAGRL